MEECHQALIQVLEKPGRRGSGRTKLSCIGRDIEYRKLTLERNGENVWELVSDSRTQLTPVFRLFAGRCPTPHFYERLEKTT